MPAPDIAAAVATPLPPALTRGPSEEEETAAAAGAFAAAAPAPEPPAEVRGFAPAPANDAAALEAPLLPRCCLELKQQHHALTRLATRSPLQPARRRWAMMPRLRMVLTRQHHGLPFSTTRSLQQAPRKVWVLQTTLLTRLRLVLKQQQRALPR